MWMSTPTPRRSAMCEQALEVGARVVGEVRRAADEVDAEVEGRLDVGVGDVGPGEGDEFDVDEAAQLVAHLHAAPARRAAGRRPSSTSTWLRTAVVPLRSSEQCRPAGAVGDRLRRSSSRRRPATTSIARPRSPIGGSMRSHERALSRWACGSAGAVSSRKPVEVEGVGFGDRRGGACRTDTR